MRFFQTILLTIAVTVPAVAQITATTSTQYVICDVSAADIDGNCLVLPDAKAPTVHATTLIDLEGQAGYSIAIDAENLDRKPVKVADAGDGDYRVFSTKETYVILFATNFAEQKQELIRLVIGKVEPPDPIDDEDEEGEEEDDDMEGPIKADWLIWIEEQDSRFAFPEQTATATSIEMRNEMADRGLKVRIYDDDQNGTVEKFTEIAGPVRPALIVYQSEGSQWRLFPAPKTRDELETIVRESVIR